MKSVSRGDALKINAKYMERDFKDKYVFTRTQPVSKPYCEGAEFLLEDFKYKDGEINITVPAGWKWDGASIPRFFWRIIGSPFLPAFREASLVHDYFYRVQNIDRKTADKLLKKILLANKVDGWTARTMYRAVRVGGGVPWRKNRKTLS